VPVTARPYETAVLSAPGARADAVSTLRQASSPQTIPPLETEVRQMLADVLLAGGAQEPEEAGNGAGLPSLPQIPKPRPRPPQRPPRASGKGRAD
jgi:hypothetical protein